MGVRLRQRVSVRLRAFLLGSIVPDIPLLLLSLWFFWQRARLGAVGQVAFGPVYDRLYFHNPLWIISTSLFHAPFLIGAMIYIGQRARERGRPWGGSLLWFGLGCALHTLMDIPTHHHDGPLLLFPFNWSYRFPAPVSYWDPAFGGRIVAPIEHSLDLAIVAYLGWLGVRRWRGRRRLQGTHSP